MQAPWRLSDEMLREIYYNPVHAVPEVGHERQFQEYNYMDREAVLPCTVSLILRQM